MSDVALRENLTRLAQAVGDECRSLRLLLNGNDDDLSDLATVDKTSLVAAINELKAGLTQSSTAAVLDDHSTRIDRAWSSSKITTVLNQRIATAQNQIVANAPASLNTLEKIAHALGNSSTDLLAFVNDELAHRVRTDTDEQSLTRTQQQNARTNIGAASQEVVGPEVDYVSLFRTGLLQ